MHRYPHYIVIDSTFHSIRLLIWSLYRYLYILIKSHVYFVGVHTILIYIGVELYLSILENTVTIAPRLMKSELEHTIQLYESKSITALELRFNIANIARKSNDADK